MRGASQVCVRLLPYALLLCGVVGGSWIDAQRVTEKPRRVGRYRLLEADLHVHTRFSDGFLSPFDVVWAAPRHQLDVIAVTEHNQIFPGQLAAWFSKQTGGPLVLVGEELTTRRYHLLAIGLQRRVHWNQSLAAAVDDIHSQGGVAIAAHPVRRFWSAFDRVADKLDGIEVMHPSAFFLERRRAWDWRDMPKYFQHAKKRNPTLAPIANSDYHFFKIMGICRTFVFAEGFSTGAVLEAIRAGRTVIYDLQGKAYGPPELIGLLHRAPRSASAPPEVGYRAAGVGDAIFRFLGWLGLLMMLWVRPR